MQHKQARRLRWPTRLTGAFPPQQHSHVAADRLYGQSLKYLLFTGFTESLLIPDQVQRQLAERLEKKSTRAAKVLLGILSGHQ